MTGRLRHLTAVAIAGGLTVGLAAPAHAGRTTNEMPVSVTVYSGCSLKTRPLMFVLPANVSNSPLDATTTITVKCTPNTNFSVDIDNGLHNNGIVRRMHSAELDAYVSYDVYRDAPRTNVWGTGQLKNVTGNSGTGAPLDLSIFGRIPQPKNIKAGDYRDTLIVTLNF